MKPFNLISLTLLASAAAVLSGCAMYNEHSTRHSSSLVNYLYPKGMSEPDKPGTPTLALPLKVGIAWVPEQKAGAREYFTSALSENRKMELLSQVVPNFKSYEFVKSIEVIPSAYLTPGGGFANLDQIRSMYGVDVIALASYDQMQFTSEGLLSFAYWTVVGAYVVQGERNDTQTMIDTVVYDVASRKLLFRAPGTSRIKASATPVNLGEQLRKDSDRGFDQAATNMVANLQQQLAQFRQRVKESPAEFKVVHKPGYTGAGSVGWVGVVLAGLLGLAAIRRSQSLSR